MEQCKNIEKGMMSGNSKEAYNTLKAQDPTISSHHGQQWKADGKHSCSEPMDRALQRAIQLTTPSRQWTYRHSKFDICHMYVVRENRNCKVLVTSGNSASPTRKETFQVISFLPSGLLDLTWLWFKTERRLKCVLLFVCC